MSFTNCCNHRFIGDNHSPIRPDGYCLHCGFHPEIQKLKEANKVLRLALENIKDKKKNFFEEENPITVAEDALYVASEIMGEKK